MKKVRAVLKEKSLGKMADDRIWRMVKCLCPWVILKKYRMFYEATGARKQNPKSKSFTTLDESEGFFWLRVLMDVKSSPGRMASRV
jgi:hypothetical protein